MFYCSLLRLAFNVRVEGAKEGLGEVVVGFVEGVKEGPGDGGFVGLDVVCFAVGSGEGACVILIVG